MFPILLVALLHPVHETVSEVEWNPTSRRLEVAMRLDVLDEQWLRRQSNARDSEYSRWATAYLRRHFRITLPAKKGEPDSARYHWIGRDEEGSHAWWYFEIEPRDGQKPTWIEVRTLLERDESYVNRILVLGRAPRRALTLTIQQPKASLEQAIHETDSAGARSDPARSDPARVDGKRAGAAD